MLTDFPLNGVQFWMIPCKEIADRVLAERIYRLLPFDYAQGRRSARNDKSSGETLVVEVIGNINNHTSLTVSRSPVQQGRLEQPGRLVMHQTLPPSRRDELR